MQPEGDIERPHQRYGRSGEEEMDHINAEAADGEVGKQPLYPDGTDFGVFAEHEDGDSHQHHVRRAIIDEQLELGGGVFGQRRHVAESEVGYEIADGKHRNADGECPRQRPVDAAQIVPQQEVTVEARKVIQHIKFVPCAGTPQFLADEDAHVGNKEGYAPRNKEPKFGALRCLLDPRGEDGHIKVQADEEVDIPHVDIIRSVGQRYRGDIIQDIGKRLLLGNFSKVGEEYQDAVGSEAYQLHQPGEGAIKYRPDQEGPQHARDTLLVKPAGIAPHGQEQRPGYHHKERDARADGCGEDGAPELDVVEIGRWLAGIEIERVGTVAAYHGEHRDETDDVEPDDVFARCKKRLFLHVY